MLQNEKTITELLKRFTDFERNKNDFFKQRHITLQKKLNSINKDWDIYLDNDLLTRVIISGYEIGIESNFTNSSANIFYSFESCFTTWNAKSKDFFINNLESRIKAKFNKFFSGNIDIPNNDRINFRLNSVKLNNNEDSENNIIVDQLNLMKKSLLELKEEFEK